MANKKVVRKTNLAERLAGAATRFSGTTAAFLLAVSIVAIWVVTGPLFDYSDTWQLVINTGTTIVTFLMVFLIQRQQNKDSLAIHLKLSELVAALEGASNRLVTVEDLNEAEMAVLHTHYRTLSALAAKEMAITESHSVEEAQARHGLKSKRGHR
jgi:low affinity Fe/Cu permease